MNTRGMFLNTLPRFPEVAVRHLRFRLAQSLGKGHPMPKSRSSFLAERTTPFMLNSLDLAGASLFFDHEKMLSVGRSILVSQQRVVSASEQHPQSRDYSAGSSARAL